jgi:hypothetical protein
VVQAYLGDPPGCKKKVWAYNPMLGLTVTSALFSPWRVDRQGSRAYNELKGGVGKLLNKA